MICHDISFASIVFWLFARLSCRALLLNGAFSPESKAIATVWFQWAPVPCKWSIIFGPTLQERPAVVQKKASRHRLLGTWKSWQVVDFNGSGVACDETLSSRVGHLLWDCLTVSNLLWSMWDTQCREVTRLTFILNLRCPRSHLNFAWRVAKTSSFRNYFKIFTTWHFACFMCSPCSSWWVAAVDDSSIHLPQPLTKTGSPTGESCGGFFGWNLAGLWGVVQW